ncbi:MAG: hypothetical protein JXB08_02440 [Bacilli bacterium]|nr:hypothetical protein [Bacilli bacterium]
MKKKLFLLFFSALALLGFAGATLNFDVEAAAAGQVTFHYQKWYEDYDDVGLWVWGTGTDGTADGVTQAGTDDFGVYFNIAIGADATEMGVIPIGDMFSDSTERWNNKDSYEGMDLTLDVSAAAAGGTMDVYFFSGSNEIFVADPTYINLFVVYFTATEEYEDNIGVHAWGDWYQDEALGTWGTWGTPTQIFTGNFSTPEGKLGKVGMMQATSTSANFIVYAGNDATKKTGDVTDALTDLSVGDVTAAYVAGDVYKGFSSVGVFADSSFAFKFVPFVNDEYALSGTYASKPNTILVKFSADVASAFYDETQTPIITEYQEYEIVGYNYIPADNPIVQDTTVYDAYTPSALPANTEGVVAFHYQKWDGDYSDVGVWTWNTGTNGSQAPVVKAGVDDFGAVIEIFIDTADSGDSIGIIPIADMINDDSRWNYRETPDGEEIQFDITSINDGTTDRIDVYYFQGGYQTTFIADPTMANVIVLYLNQSGEYTATTGLHTWGWVENATDWGTPLPMVEAFANPAGLKGIGAMVQATPASIASGDNANPGIIVHDGDTKYSGDANIQFKADGTTSYFADMVAGDVMVIYSGIEGETAGSYSYTQDRAAFVDELMNYVKGDPIYDYVTYEKEEYPRVAIDLLPFFSLWDGTTELTGAIEELNYNLEDDAITELVVVLATGYELESGHDYILKFDNGETDPATQQVAEIAVDIDDEAPVITFITDDTVSIVAGEGWDSELWPVLRATDDRDGLVTDRIYVKSGDGTVDMNAVGDHIVTLTVFDEWGNESTAAFTITVTEPATGCGAASASIAGIGFLGIIVFFARRKEWF